MRLATFNCENLFARYKFKSNFEPTNTGGFTINDLAFDIFDEVEKQITAKAIIETGADIIALQEVESLPVLDYFNSRYLAPMKYRHRLLVDSHDPRGIDVAILSRYPITSVCSHREERNANNTGPLFSRDCLETQIDISGKLLFLYINHFKSMVGGRDETKSKRVEQVNRVADIIDARWKASDYSGNFAVLGDLNDYVDDETSLLSLTEHPGLNNIINRLPSNDQWTHFYAKENEYRQLDYIFISKSLALANTGLPGIMRKGMPYRAEKYTGPRFEHVGDNNPKASDHAPVYIDLEIC